jgi:hypothetical protein
MSIKGGANGLVDGLADGAPDLAESGLVDRLFIDVVCADTSWNMLVLKTGERLMRNIL